MDLKHIDLWQLYSAAVDDQIAGDDRQLSLNAVLQAYINRYKEFRYYYGARESSSVKFDENDARMVHEIYTTYYEYIGNLLKNNPHVLPALKSNNFYLFMEGNCLFISFEGCFNDSNLLPGRGS